VDGDRRASASWKQPADGPRRGDWWRFELRRRHPGRNIPSDWVMGFGAWQPSDDRVLVCQLAPLSIDTSQPLKAFLRSLGSEVALVWVDLLEMDPGARTAVTERD
jgi:hypothetical protein